MVIFTTPSLFTKLLSSKGHFIYVLKTLEKKISVVQLTQVVKLHESLSFDSFFFIALTNI